MDLIRQNKKELIKLSVYIIIVLAVIFIINKFFFALIKVNGESMNPALRNNDLLIVDKTVKEEEYQRFDIVAFEYIYNNKDIYLKRIIGLPNETIQIIDNEIYINDEKLEEYYGAFSNADDSPDIVAYLSDYPRTTLGVDEYFVIGDNRYVSDDSRNFGPITGDLFVGKAVFRIWSFDGVGSLKYQ